MGMLEFRCGGCGAPYQFPSDQIPPQGIKGLCEKCGAGFTVLPGGAVDAAGPKPPPVPPPASIPQRPAPGGEAAATGAVVFSCPSCGRSHKVPRERIPQAGARGPCSGCKAILWVTPDGSASLASSPAAASPEARWEVQLDGQTLGPFSTADLKQAILDGRLPPDRLVRPAGGDWASASSFSALAPFFAPQGVDPGQESYGNEDRCYMHPHVQPSHLCSQCHRHLCPACLKDMRIHGSVRPVHVCPACGGPAAAIQRRQRWTPFYRDLSHILALPFSSGHALMYFGFLSLLQVLKIPCAAVPIWGWSALVILTVLQTSFYLKLVTQVANGEYGFPEWPDMTNFAEMFWLFLRVVFVTIVSVLPMVLVFCLAGAGAGMAAGAMGGAAGAHGLLSLLGPWVILALALAVFYAAYLPIGICIVAVFNTVVPALNPVIILRVIFRIGPVYGLAVALWIALAIIEGVVGLVASSSMLGIFLHAPLEVYTTLISGILLGRVAYEHEDDIGWS